VFLAYIVVNIVVITVDIRDCITVFCAGNCYLIHAVFWLCKYIDLIARGQNFLHGCTKSCIWLIVTTFRIFSAVCNFLL